MDCSLIIIYKLFIFYLLYDLNFLSSYYLLFSIIAKPYWLQLLRDVEIAVEDSLYWECRASGKPKPSYRWLKNGDALVLEVR